MRLFVFNKNKKYDRLNDELDLDEVRKEKVVNDPKPKSKVLSFSFGRRNTAKTEESLVDFTSTFRK